MNSITADRYFYIVGRFLLGLYFLLPGLTKVFLFQENLNVVITREVPFPYLSLSLVAIAQILFGSMLMIGKNVHMGALVLAVVTLLINFYIHDFWNMEAGANQAHETQNFIKNLGIFSGLLILARKKN